MVGLCLPHPEEDPTLSDPPSLSLPHSFLFRWLSSGIPGPFIPLPGLWTLLATDQCRAERAASPDTPERAFQKGKLGKRSPLESVAFLAFLKVAKMWLCLSKFKKKKKKKSMPPPTDTVSQAGASLGRQIRH